MSFDTDRASSCWLWQPNQQVSEGEAKTGEFSVHIMEATIRKVGRRPTGSLLPPRSKCLHGWTSPHWRLHIDYINETSSPDGIRTQLNKSGRSAHRPSHDRRRLRGPKDGPTSVKVACYVPGLYNDDTSLRPAHQTVKYERAEVLR